MVNNNIFFVYNIINLFIISANVANSVLMKNGL